MCFQYVYLYQVACYFWALRPLIFFFQRLPFVFFILPCLAQLDSEEISDIELSNSVFYCNKDEAIVLQDFQRRINERELQPNHVELEPELDWILRRRTEGTRAPSIKRLKTKSGALEQNQNGTCPICMMNYESGDKVAILGCHKNHLLHDECLTAWKKHCETKRTKASCPICRKDINFSKV